VAALAEVVSSTARGSVVSESTIRLEALLVD
jgi:hypothetical protein